jgi:divalent metal cation (Fe/Co/Zn/Cd) transporter
MAYRDWQKIGLALVMITMAYNAVEAVVAIASGALAGSIALVGFGLDSVIEIAAAGALMWRLAAQARGAPGEVVERRERLVRAFVGVTFLLLALYVTVQSGAILWTGLRPGESIVGIVLAVASLVVMPLVAWGKMRAARELRSAALRAEARETLACSYLSLALLAGLALNRLAGLWWADPVAALVMVPWLVKEGIEGLRGDED